MSDAVYTLAEEIAIGGAISLEPDFLPCDLVGCSAMASLLIPGASVCASCWKEHLDENGRYFFHHEQLVGGQEWRDARCREYAERVALTSPRRRNPEWDAILDEQIRHRVELLLEVERLAQEFDFDP